MPIEPVANKIEGLMLDRFLKEYSSSNMLRSMRILVNWKERNGRDFPEKWIERLQTGDREALEVDQARRMVSHYFQRALLLYDNKYVSKTFVTAVCSLSGVTIMFDVIEDLEKVLDVSNKNLAFKRLRKLCPKTLRTSSKLVPVPKRCAD